MNYENFWNDGCFSAGLQTAKGALTVFLFTYFFRSEFSLSHHRFFLMSMHVCTLQHIHVPIVLFIMHIYENNPINRSKYNGLSTLFTYLGI